MDCEKLPLEEYVHVLIEDLIHTNDKSLALFEMMESIVDEFEISSVKSEISILKFIKNLKLLNDTGKQMTEKKIDLLDKLYKNFED